jgi:lysine 6-dehydrogenase
LKILVLGGCGIQGKAAVFDLAGSPGIDEIICADADLSGIRMMSEFMDMSRVRATAVDANDPESLVRLCNQADAVIDLLPRQFMENVCRAAIHAGVGVVNTNYAYPIAHLNEAARRRAWPSLPECGLDPGIDLVLYGEARRRFDELKVINSYCGGIPGAHACDNPLNYKVSWVFEGVLASTKRDSRIIRAARLIDIPVPASMIRNMFTTWISPAWVPWKPSPTAMPCSFTDALGVTPNHP